MSVENEIAIIEEDMALGDAGEYWHREDLQRRYSDLLQARDNNLAPPPRDHTAARKAELEAMVADGMSDYWRGPKRDQLQAEYEALLAGRVIAKTEQAPEPSELSARIDEAFGHLDTRDLDDSFSGLSDGVQQAIAHALHGNKDAILDLPPAELDEFRFFIDSMSEEEWQAAQTLV